MYLSRPALPMLGRSVTWLNPPAAASTTEGRGQVVRLPCRPMSADLASGLGPRRVDLIWSKVHALRVWSAASWPTD